MILQLNPPISLLTEKGKAWAHFLIDYGMETDLIFVCFIDETGECWCYRNRDVRLQKNITMNRLSTSPIDKPQS
jgi:hypothetical protein